MSITVLCLYKNGATEIDLILNPLDIQTNTWTNICHEMKVVSFFCLKKTQLLCFFVQLVRLKKAYLMML